MSWNDWYWKSSNDTDLRTGYSGSRRSTEITGYQHLFARDQEVAEQLIRGADGPHSDAARVWYCC